jgi:hypothetical protein
MPSLSETLTRGEEPRQYRSPVLPEMEHRGQGGEHQRADERRQEQGVDDRLVDRLECADEGPVIGLAEAGHDGVRVGFGRSAAAIARAPVWSPACFAERRRR